MAKLSGVHEHGDVTRRLPNTANLRFEGADAEAVVANMDPVAVSTGSACSSGSIEPFATNTQCRDHAMTADVDYALWYPDVPPVMDTKQLAELLNTNEQIVRAYARDGTVPAHRKPGGRKFTSSAMRSSTGSWRTGTSLDQMFSRVVPTEPWMSILPDPDRLTLMCLETSQVPRPTRMIRSHLFSTKERPQWITLAYSRSVH